MGFEEALRDLGFTFSRRGRGGDTYEHRASDHLTYHVLDPGDGTLLFTWELAITEWAAARGMQVGSDEQLNTFLFPREDATGPRDAAWVSQQMDVVESRLREASLL